MLFFTLSHPCYETDFEYDVANPVRSIEDIWLPGMVCSECGMIWAGSRRLYLKLHDANLQRRLCGEPLPKAQWERLAHEAKAAIHLPDDFVLQLGDVLGTPAMELLAGEIPDFLHPFPGQLVVRARVVEILERQRFTGFRPVRVEVRRNEQMSISLTETPELYELVVTGSAWRPGSDLDHITACRYCGRTTFPDPGRLTVDTKRWDGSDFFHVDKNPNIVFVTERVCSVLTQHRFSNYACNPVNSV